MTETKDFPTLDVVSVTSGVLVSWDNGMDAIYNVTSWMLDEPIFTHQLPDAAEAVRPILVEQHPWLEDVSLPAGDIPALQDITEAIVHRHGDTLTVAKPDEVDWVQGNALMSMLDAMGKKDQ